MMGYTNPDKRLVNVSPKEKRAVRVLRRRAERRALTRRARQSRAASHPPRLVVRMTIRHWHTLLGIAFIVQGIAFKYVARHLATTGAMLVASATPDSGQVAAAFTSATATHYRVCLN